MGRWLDEKFPTPGMRIVGLLLVIMIAGGLELVGLGVIGGLIFVVYVWWWAMTVYRLKDGEEYEID